MSEGKEDTKRRRKLLIDLKKTVNSSNPRKKGGLQENVKGLMPSKHWRQIVHNSEVRLCLRFLMFSNFMGIILYGVVVISL